MSDVKKEEDGSGSKEPEVTDEPGPSKATSKKRSHASGAEPQSCCALCQDVLKDPLSAVCGHRFCTRCFTSHWDQAASPEDCSCPRCGKRLRLVVYGDGPECDSADVGSSRKHIGTGDPVMLKVAVKRLSIFTDYGLQKVLDEHKVSLRTRPVLFPGETGSGIPLNRIYTDLYITEGQSEDGNTQHEVWQLETTSKMESLHETPIECKDIFKASPDQRRRIRVVLTNGVAGIGKTVSVQKFTLDWAEGLENQDVSLVVPLSFRELNLIKDERYSLLKLLHVFHPTLQKVPAENLAVCKPLFIFDGLDESRLSLDFSDRKVITRVTQESSVSSLLTNLIKGNLLPSALVWITSRPAAAKQIPPERVDRVTEVRGFTDEQKEKYFRRRFGEGYLSRRIISHIETSKSLHIMCQIPVFCWITAMVLEHMLTTDQRGELPKTLTDMYSHFLLVQTKRKKQKYDGGRETSPQALTEIDRELLLKLGKLAFTHLDRGNIMFYQEDLEQCGLDVSEALVYSGVCTEIFKRECVIFHKTVYCFVHLSIQEFLAAVYMFHCYTNRSTEVLQAFLGQNYNYSTLDDLLKTAMEKSLQSKNGHLDLFVRFLHGLSLESNRRLLGGLLDQTDNSPETIQRAINNLKEMNIYRISPDRCINIFHCLMEMNELSVHQEMQKYLESDSSSEEEEEQEQEQELSLIQCSALAYMLLMFEGGLEKLDLREFNTSVEGQWRLIPAVRNCRRAVLSWCGLPDAHCEVLALALKSSQSHLTELDLSYNEDLPCSGLKLLCAGLESPSCRLQSLTLMRCSLSVTSCSSLASALESNPSHLRDLNLSENGCLQDSGVEALEEFLGSPRCRLETLSLWSCGLTGVSCASLAAASRSPSSLLYLDLSTNELQDAGVKLLAGALERPDCRLRALRLWGCGLSAVSCASLAKALEKNPSSLRELDLSESRIQDAGVKLLAAWLQSPDCRLEALRLSSCGLSEVSCAHLASALGSNPSPLSELDLSDNELKDVGVQHLAGFLRTPFCRLSTLRLQRCSLSGLSCAHLASALLSNPSGVRELHLRGNDLQYPGSLLSPLLEDPRCKLVTLSFSGANGSPVSLEGDIYVGSCWMGNRSSKSEHKSDAAGSSRTKKEPGPALNRPACTKAVASQPGQGGTATRITGSQFHRDRQLRRKRSESMSVLEERGATWLELVSRKGDGECREESESSGSSESSDSLLGKDECSRSTVSVISPPVHGLTRPDPSSSQGRTWDRVDKDDPERLQEIIFKPHLLIESGKPTYRFWCPGPGVFRCALTGLVFAVSRETKLTYSTVLWNESLVQSAGKTAAGPLFDISCSEDAALSQLHLPHCDTKDALSIDGILSVVLIGDDGMSILDPLRITDTHVVVEVPHLSVFGLVWDYIKRFSNVSLPIIGQVLLFLRPPHIGHPVLDVFLLQSNIPLTEVAEQQEGAVNIRISSDCPLIVGQNYLLSCQPETSRIQPAHVQFRSHPGPNFYPTFEVFLIMNPEMVTLRLRDEEQQGVWERDVYLTGARRRILQRNVPVEERVPATGMVPVEERVPAMGMVPVEERVPAMGMVPVGQRVPAQEGVPVGQRVPAQEGVPPEERLFSVRLEFIQRVSDQILNQLLDELYHLNVLNFLEMQTIRRMTGGKAGEVIDNVRNKGSAASSHLIAAICRLDEHLAYQLNLR